MTKMFKVHTHLISFVILGVTLTLFSFVSSAAEFSPVRERVIRGEEVFDYIAINEFFTANDGDELFKIRNTSTIVKQALVSELIIDNNVGAEKAKMPDLSVAATSVLNGRPTLFACFESCADLSKAKYAAFQRRGAEKYSSLPSEYVRSNGQMRPVGPISKEYAGVFLLVDSEFGRRSEVYDSYVLKDITKSADGVEVATIVQTRLNRQGEEAFVKPHQVSAGSWLNVGSRARLKFMLQGGVPLFLITGISNANY